MRRIVLPLCCLLLAGCQSGDASPAPAADSAARGERSSPPGAGTASSASTGFSRTTVATLDEPWAMAFLPDGTAAITRRTGQLVLMDVRTGRSRVVAGTPQVVAAGQGGLGDVMPSPTFATDGLLYLSWVERGDGGTGAVVGRARLVGAETSSPRLEALGIIWRQPKVEGSGHFSHRLAFSPDGAHLFVSSGDRQKMEPAQDRGLMLGKILRMRADGSEVQTWSLGHRNPLGLAFDGQGRLWSSEMGPRGGDELNLIRQGGNYGWPRASHGTHYDGTQIPLHHPGDGFVAPSVWWNPSVSPGSLMIYDGSAFPAWRGDAFLGALSGEALIRVHLDGTSAQVADQWPMGARIREVEQGPDGAIYLLQDGSGADLIRLSPR